MRDKFLTEAMGECWHEWDGGNTKPYHDGAKIYFCKCGECVVYDEFYSFTKDVNKHFKIANNFSTWDGFGKLWEWCHKQEWWQASYGAGMLSDDLESLTASFVHPDRFAYAVYEYLKSLSEVPK